MDNTMLFKALREFNSGLLNHLIVNLAGEDGERWLREFKKFLRKEACWVVSPVLAIDRTKKFNPTTFIGPGWTIWRGPANGDGLYGDMEQDLDSLALKEVDWANFETFLHPGETSITGEEKFAQLKKSGKIVLDALVGEALLVDYKSRGSASVLENLRRERGIKYLDFFGTILRNPDGGRCVLYLCSVGGQWHWRVRRLSDRWHSWHFSAYLES